MRSGDVLSDPAETRRSARRQVGIIVATGFAIGVFTMSLTILNPLILTIARQLGLAATVATLVVVAPLLSAVVAVPVMAKWGESAGRRRVLLVALVALAAGSLLAAVAPSLPPLLLGQALRGVGAGAFPMVFSIIRRECDETYRRVGVSAIGGCNFFGQGLGGVVAGVLLARAADFRAVFWFTFGAAVTAAVIVRIVVPATPAPERTAHVPDILGAVTLGGALVCAQVLLGFGQGWGWLSVPTVGLAAATVALVLGWVAAERRASNPLVALPMVRIPIVWRANLGGFVAGIALFGAGAGVATFVQLPYPASGLNLSVLGSALVVLPLDLMMLAGAPLVGYAARYVSPRTTLTAGPIVIAAAFAVLVASHTSLVIITALMALVGLGTALTFASIGIVLTEEVPPAETGPVLGVNFVTALTGSALSGAIFGAVLSASTAAPGGIPETGGFVTYWAIGIAAALVASLIMGTGGRRRAAS